MSFGTSSFVTETSLNSDHVIVILPSFEVVAVVGTKHSSELMNCFSEEMLRRRKSLKVHRERGTTLLHS